MIVADTNVVAYLLMAGDRTSEVESLYRRNPVWAAPVLWRSEFLNVMCTYLRAGRLDLATCLELERAASELLGERTFTLPALRVLETSLRTGCAGYDSEFVALAEDLGVPLVTYDRALLRACPAVAREPSAVR